MAFKLLETFVQITVRGEKDVDKAFARQEKQAAAAEASAGKIGDSYEKSAKKSEGAIGRMTKKVAELNGATDKMTKKPSVLKIELEGQDKVSTGLKTLGREKANLEKGRITLTTTLEGSREVLADFQRIEGVKTRIDGDRVTLTVDVDGTAEGAAKLERFEQLSSRIDGDELRAHIEVTGAPQAISELTAVNAVAGRVDGRDIDVSVDVDTGGGIAQLLFFQTILATVGGAIQRMDQGLSAGGVRIAMIGGLAATAAALFTPLLGALAAVGSLGAAAGAGIGLIATPIAMVISRLSSYHESLDKAGTAQKAVATSADTLASANNRVEDAERQRESALEGLESALDEAADAQQELNDAMEDEPTNQAQNELDLEEAVDREDDARKQYNEDVKKYGENSEEASDSLREWKQAQLDLDQQERDSQRIRERGSDQLVSALERREAAQNGVKTATEQVEAAERALEEAQAAVAEAAANQATAMGELAAVTETLPPPLMKLYRTAMAFKDAAFDAFTSAQNAAARFGTTILNDTTPALGLLGRVSTAAINAVSARWDQFITRFKEPVQQSSVLTILASVNDILGPLTAAIFNVVLALINIFAAATPAAISLAQTIERISMSILTWSQSSGGVRAIRDAIAASVPIFAALWDMVLRVGGALFRFGVDNAPAIATAINFVTSALVWLIDGFNRLTQIFGPVTIIIAALTPIFLGVMLIVGQLGAAIVSLIGTAFTIASVFSGPVLLAILALVAAGVLLVSNWDRIKSALAPLVPIFQRVKAVILDLGTVIKGLFTGNTGTEQFRRAFADLPGPVQRAIQVIVLAWRSLKNGISQAWTQMRPILTAMRSGLITALGTAFNFLLGQGRQFVSWWRSAWPGIRSAVMPVITAVGNGLRTILGAAFNASLQNGRILVNWFRTNWPLIRLTAATVFNAVRTVVVTAFRVIWAIVRPIISALASFWRQNSTQILNIARQVWTIIKTVIQTVLRTVLGLVRAAMQFITGDWRGGFNTLLSVARGILNAIVTVARSLLSILGSVFKIALNVIWGVVKSIFTAIKDAVISRLTEMWNRGKEIVSGLKDSAVSAFEALRDKAGEIFNSVKERIIGPVEEARDRLKEIWNDILEGVAKVLDAIPGLGDLASDVRGAKFETGGSTDAKASRTPSRYAGAQAFAVGGVIDKKQGGVSGPRDPRYHLWGEGDYDEAYLSTDPRFRKNNDNYAAWYADKTGGLYWPAKTRKIAEGYNRMADLMRRGKFVSGQNVYGRGPHRRGRMGNVADDSRWQGNRFFKAGGLSNAEAQDSDASKAAQATAEWAHQYDGRGYLLGGSHPGETDCCIPADVRIDTPDGPKRMDEISTGDLVYSRNEDGTLSVNPVVAQWFTRTQATYTVTTKNRAVRASENHPFLRVVKTGSGRPSPTNAHGFRTEWARLDELSVGDWIVTFTGDAEERHEDYLEFGDRFVLDENLALILGHYAGDGFLTQTGGVVISEYDRLKRDRLQEAADKALGVRFTEDDDTSNGWGLKLFSREFVRLIEELFGKGKRAHTKRVPEDIGRSPKSVIRAYLDGYAAADGSELRDHRRGNEYRKYGSVSREMLEEVRALHIRLGDHVSNISSYDYGEKPTIIRGKTVLHRHPVNEFCVYHNSVRSRGIPSKANNAIRAEFGSGSFSVQAIRSIEVYAVEDTFDMEVEGDHNFIADGVVVHNSGWQNVVFLRYSGNTSPSGRTPYGATMSMDQAVPASGAKEGSANPGYTVGWYNGGPAGGHTAGHLAWSGGEENTETGGSHNSTMTGGPAAGPGDLAAYAAGPLHIMSYGPPGEIKGGGGGGGLMDWVREKAEQLWEKYLGPIYKKLKDFGPHVLARGAGQLSVNTLDGIKEWVFSKIPLSGGGGGGPGGPGVGGPGGGDPAANRALGEEMLSASGVPGSFSSLDLLWQKESGWSQTAENPSSGAYGIPQALPGSKMGAAANPPESNPRAQIDWGLGYIADRYGSTDSAWDHSQSVGWYSEGGIATADQLMRIAEDGAQEVVIPLKGRGAQIARDALGVGNLREEMRVSNRKLDGVIAGLRKVGLDESSQHSIKQGALTTARDFSKTREFGSAVGDVNKAIDRTKFLQNGKA